MTGAEPISVIGLGKVGLGLAACLAKNGFDVFGVDHDVRLVDLINARTATIDEPGVDAVIAKTMGGILRTGADIAAAVAHSDTAFLLLPTPSHPDGSFDANTLTQALKELCLSIRAQNKQRYLIIIGSTVSPGTIAGVVIPIIEQILRQPIGENISVCYNPELVALGSVITDFERPDLIIIGESDSAAGAAVERIHRKIVRNNPLVHHMSFVDAEIAKLALNNFLTVKISFANFLSQICSRIEGADVDRITSVLASDSRIGGKFMRAGPAFGGPCFPRDTEAFAALALEGGPSAGLVHGVNEINRAQHDLLAEIVKRQVRLSGVQSVGILGLSYKESTPYVIESASIALIKTLHASGIRITAYDPLALKTAALQFGELFEAVTTANACVHAAAVIVLINKDSTYSNAILSYKGGDAKVVVDCWRALDAHAAIPNVKVVKLGYWSEPT